MDRLPYTDYQRRIGWILVICFALDAVDLIMMSFLLAPISQDLQLSVAEAGIAGSAVFAGVGVGAAIGGFLADRFGRRTVLVYTMALWGIASLLTACSWDLWSFATFRFITGVGLGAELPAAFALVAEFMPRTRRASMSGWMHAGSQAGAVMFNLASFAVVMAVGGALGWRLMFGSVFFVALFAMYVRRRLPESPRWYEASGHHDQASYAMAEFEREVEVAHRRPLPPVTDADILRVDQPARSTRFRELLSSDNAERTLFAWALWFIVLLGFYGITVWVGKILVDRGMEVSDAIAVGVVITAFGIPAAWISGQMMERIGRKPVILAALVLVGLTAFAYGNVTGLAWIIITGSAMHFSLVCVATALYAYTPELFPTRIRSTGLGSASAVGRVAAVSGPLLIPLLIVHWGYSGAFFACASCFVIAAFLVVIFGPETRNRSLENISR